MCCVRADQELQQALQVFQTSSAGSCPKHQGLLIFEDAKWGADAADAGLPRAHSQAHAQVKRSDVRTLSPREPLPFFL